MTQTLDDDEMAVVAVSQVQRGWGSVYMIKKKDEREGDLQERNTLISLIRERERDTHQCCVLNDCNQQEIISALLISTTPSTLSFFSLQGYEREILTAPKASKTIQRSREGESATRVRHWRAHASHVSNSESSAKEGEH